MSACVCRSALEAPPTHEARISVSGPVDDKQLTAAHSRFLRKLRGRGCEYLAVNEWKQGKRHLHILIRAAAEITAKEVGQWWQASLPPGARASSHCAPLRNVMGFIRYIFKDMRGGGELPSSTFKGKIYTSSRRFLVRKLGVLWKEVRDQWDRRG